MWCADDLSKSIAVRESKYGVDDGVTARGCFYVQSKSEFVYFVDGIVFSSFSLDSSRNVYRAKSYLISGTPSKCNYPSAETSESPTREFGNLLFIKQRRRRFSVGANPHIFLHRMVSVLKTKVLTLKLYRCLTAVIVSHSSLASFASSKF